MAKLNDTYDIGQAFQVIEEELIASMIRNMKRHKVEEIKEDKQWAMWQAIQLESLEKFKRKNRKKYNSVFESINNSIDKLIQKAYEEGGMNQEIDILRQIERRYGDNLSGKIGRIKRAITSKLPFGSKVDKDFFQVNDDRLEELVKATKGDMHKAEHAMLRMADDKYRKIIFNAQVYAFSGAGTYQQAVDMATKDFLSAGINCIEYKNGRRVNIKSYVEMVLRTSQKRAQLYADGKVREKLGIHTVILKKRMNACPKCLPFMEKIMIDDVYSGGNKSDEDYPLLSHAMRAGLFHPNCKDHLSTYIEGVSTPPDSKFTRQEIDDISEQSFQEEKKLYAQRQAEKYDRLAKYSLDEENQKKYQMKADEWKTVANSGESDTIKEILTRQLENLSQEEKDIITEYTGLLAQNLNAAISNKKVLSKSLQYKKETLERALSKCVIPENITVIRKTIPDFMNVFPKRYKYTEIDMRRLTGKVLQNTSFTINVRKAHSFRCGMDSTNKNNCVCIN